MDKLILIIKGYFIGIANIIPGVSGGTIALILGIYEKLINSINTIFKNFKKNITFLIPIGIGVLLSIITGSRIISKAYDFATVPTFMFFVGLVIGGVPMIRSNINNRKDKNIANYSILGFTVIFVVFLACYKMLFGLDFETSFENMTLFKYFLLFIIGMIASATMVIPGVSGSLVLMILGYYYPILKTITNITKNNGNMFSNLIVLGIFGIGVLIGIVLISKLIERLFEICKVKTYYAILGFIYGSIIAIPISTFVENKNVYFDIYHLLAGIFTLILGTVISYKLSTK